MNSLSHLFKPTSVAVVGASIRTMRAGNIVMKNLLQGGFEGAIMPVTPRYSSVCGVLAYKTIESLPITPDVAILCTNASRNLDLFKQLAKKKVKAAIVLSADMHRETSEGFSIQDACLDIAQKFNIRILGPNSLGIMLPWVNFNASFSPITAQKGKIAFISQSAAMCTTILDWANDKNIGFSAFISIGNAHDIDLQIYLIT